MHRRTFLTTSASLAASGTMLLGNPAAALAGDAAPSAGKDALRFRPDGTFKILVISDLHYIPEPDQAGIALTRKLIDIEKPDLVIATGDNISGDRCDTPADVEAAVRNVGIAMESRKVPWAVVLGNHDQEHVARTGVTREQVFNYYERYPFNRNGGWQRGISGAGNKDLLIWDAQGKAPVNALWLIDSGESYPDKSIRYDWIHTDQIAWYWKTSKLLEQRYGHKVPGLMFFHIPLPEFREMVMSRKVIGERHETESPSGINSGMFAAVLDRGDVKGIFCGHDHVNNYLGKFHGVTLGQAGVVGFYGYPHTPPEDVTNDRARGARVIQLDQANPDRFKSWMRFRDGTTNWESWSDAYVETQIK
ncbi:metallophosphoesterase family protein [Novosphingobium mangrovi (ex Huang et al. 2023)]|uniref:Metallophosphoesterase family protein n=1 Tax=Novosphingobium mangrovi (ex Huang et al. 2023) TaxID=2976432 RepID=A0ABT2I8P5_9SPHN|nr:metallophosphoesterase family protein [Novosphingobium mangrovi (ex Huang et al. 2023)]MCT2401168.1 metallophosphoesterase family protein [Novosphingobium mangrovi (ex Huang et al. 2023)]